MTISTITTQYGIFTLTDNELDTIEIIGPVTATFSYLIRSEGTVGADIYSGHAATLKAAFDFCLNYSREKDAYDSRIALQNIDTNHGIIKNLTESISEDIDVIKSSISNIDATVSVGQTNSQNFNETLNTIKDSILSIDNSISTLSSLGSVGGGIITKGSFVPSSLENALTLNALRESGKLEDIIESIKKGESVESLIENDNG